MSVTSTSSMFNKLTQLTFSQECKSKAEQQRWEEESGAYSSIDEALTAVGEGCDYRMLPLVINFMHDMTPFDLYSFFDMFSDIEEDIFKAYGIDYSPIKKAYKQTRTAIRDDFISFIIDYYKTSNTEIKENLDKYDEKQIDFIILRFNTVQYLLIEIGKRLSHECYKDIIVADGSV